MNDFAKQDFAKRIAALSPEQRALFELQLQQQALQQTKPLPKLPEIARRNHTDALPLSFAQQRLWFLDQLQPGSPQYNVSAAMHLRGRLHITVLERALNEIVSRHEILRTTFPAINGQPVQAIAAALKLPLVIVDLQAIAETRRDAAAQQLARDEMGCPFDLAQGPLMRSTLVQVREDESWLLVTLHHIISDGWCRGVFIRELTALYEAFVQGQPSPLAALPIQYADFALWQRQRLQGDVLETQLAYWQQRLQDSPAVLDLPTDRPRPALQSFRGARQLFELPNALVTPLKSLSQRWGVTLFMTLLAAFQTLLHRYTGQTDILVGSPIANRNQTEVEGLIGFFANTLVLRTDVSGNPSFETLLQRVQSVALNAYAHQDVPFEKLVESLQPDRTLSYSPLFQVMFTLQSVPLTTIACADLILEPVLLDNGTARFDWMLNLSETPDAIRGICEYNTDLFESATIVRMLGQFQRLLEGIVANPQQQLSELPLLTETEIQQQLVTWNPIQSAKLPHECLHQWFEVQVEKTPEAIALTFEQQHLTYAELNRRANQLTHHLRRLGVGSDVLVGICLERSPALVIAILAVLKAGGAYVPLDPSYPADRLAFILEDADSAVLLTQQSLIEGLPESKAQVVCVDVDWSVIQQESDRNPSDQSSPDALAYVIYTSGSTGKPKGVQIPHRAVVNFLHSMQQTPGLTAQDALLSVTTISFDIAALELFLPLVTGAKVEIASRAIATDGTQLAALLAKTQATVMQATPATWQMLITTGWQGSDQLKLLCGGEALSWTLATALLERCQTLWNLYGPTETTIWSAVSRVDVREGEVYLGNPIANTQFYVLDPHQNPVPIGVAGELHIGGLGLARGYLNRAELTAEKFIPHPFETEKATRLYRTGDLVRYRTDGRLEFLGRIDHQVKIRGFRIELGEIEAVLNQHPAVQTSVVVDREVQGDNFVKLRYRHLIAYIQSQQAITAGEFRGFLKQTLPDYMVPSAFVTLKALPLTPNGKIDRRSLPALDITPTQADVFTPPRTPVEEILAGIWATVLGLESVSIHHNFFELGGHSLLATQVMAQIQQAFQIDLPLRQLFELPTIATLAAAIESVLHTEAMFRIVAIQPIPRSEALPVSFAQQRLWFLAQLEPDSPFYILPAAIRLQGDLHIAALQQSFSAIVQRHEVLRTRFRAEQGHPMAEIAAISTMPLPVIDLSTLPEAIRDAELQRLAQADAHRSFNLETDVLLRVTVLKLGDRDHVMLLAMHHIATDGWSIGILIRELAMLYPAFCQEPSDTEPAATLPDIPIQYADFAAWQRQHLPLEAQLTYWQQQLADAPAVLALPTDYPRTPIQTFRGSSHRFTLSHDLTTALKTLSQQEGCTLFMTLLAGFTLLLGRYANTEDIIVGSPIANRTRAELEHLIGFFVNTLVLRTDLAGQLEVRQLLRRVRDMALAAYAHQDLPFEQLVEALQPERDLSHTPLFQVMFVLQNAPLQTLDLSDLTVCELELDRQIAKFDLTLSIAETAAGLVAKLEYNTALFAAETIARMSEQLQTLWAAMVAHPDQRIWELPLLTATEQQRLVEWNAPRSPQIPDGNLIDWIEQQVERSPDAIAVICADQQLTFRELNQRANQLAHNLIQLGIAPEVMVGLCVERSVEMLVGLLGILKAGGAYVPLDPTYPSARLSFILDDAHVAVLVTQSHLLPLLPHHPNILCLGRNASKGNDLNPIVDRLPEHLAYVIYTSGSTGTPKGTLITQRGFANYLHWCTQAYAVEQGNGTLVHSSLAFDLTITGLFSPLLVGRPVELVPEHLGIEGLGIILRQRSHLSLVKLTPAQLQLLSEQISPSAAAGCTRAFIIGGENLLPEHLAFWQAFAPNTRLINEYGPTETVVGCCIYDVPLGQSFTGAISIGQAIAHTELYVLDAYCQPVPLGVVGELYIGGAGLARGYLHQPELTAAKFIPHPFSSVPGARLYKTGDLARYRADGTLECLDRRDHQVKIRGFRIECGEIETALTQHPAIQQAIVLAHDVQDSKQLIAYLVYQSVSQPEPLPTVNDLRHWLKTKLPEYMVPASFVWLEALPLTPNGKIDRRALLALKAEESVSETAIVPSSPVEEIIAGIWRQVLAIEQLGTHDNFFELGGHSLLATRVISQVRQAFRVDVPLRSLFESPTVAELARTVEPLLNTDIEATSAIAPIDRTKKLSLSFAQQRLWFLAQLEPDSPFYNISAAVRLEGELDIAALWQSLNAIVARHEVFRTAFEAVEGIPVPVVSAAIALELPLVDLREMSPMQQAAILQTVAQTEASQPFALDRSPLLRVKLLQLQAQEYVLLFTMHHIVSDGWSTGVLITELARLYDVFRQGKPSPLAALPIQYVDFAAWQRQQFKEERLEAQLTYWQHQLSGMAPVLALPSDRPRPAVQSFHGATHPVQLSAALTQALKRFSQQQGCTVFMTLLAAFQMLLGRYSGSEDVVVGSPVANRNRAEIEGLIGFFVNTLVLRLDLSGNPTVREVLRRMREVALGAYAHQDLPFDRLVEALQPERNLSHPPLFQVMFILQNAPIAALQLSELTVSLLTPQTQAAKFDLTLALRETDDGLVGWLEYNRDLFEAATIARIAFHWQQLLERMIADPDHRYGDLALLTAAEQHQLLNEWNQTTISDSDNLCLHQWIEAQVTQMPEAIALTFEQQHLTYAELNRRANQLADYLRHLGVRADVLVGICLERSPELMVAMLAVLKAGGAYVPLDPSYPSERLAFILDDADSAVLLTQQSLLESLPTSQAQVVCVDLDWCAIQQESDRNPSDQSSPDDLAYVIYTSGSTGKPKGVQIPHRAVVNFLHSMQQTPGLTAQDALLSVTTISFDIAALELFLPLVTGAKVEIASRAIAADGIRLAALLTQTQATVMQATPATWQMLITTGWQGSDQLKLLCGGEALSWTLATALLERCQTLWNLYGPTETTIWSAVGQVESKDQAVYMGGAIANTQFYVLDPHQNPVPIGVVGELHIGGLGLARGYLNRAELTAEKFVPHPFETEKATRLYRTGDLVRYRADGRLEFLGRIDHQVKIRGFRIELGEIEAALNQHSAIRSSIVVVQGNPSEDQALVAYLVPHSKLPLELSELRQFLSQTLPDYMVPSTYVCLESLPLTPNGKADRRALPAPQTATRLTSAAAYVTPRNQLEQAIAHIWQQILQIEAVGIHENFFDLGGHSLRLVQVHSQLQHRLNTDFPLLELFRYPTIGALAAFLSHRNGDPPVDSEAQDDRAHQLQQGKARLQQVLKLSQLRQ